MIYSSNCRRIRLPERNIPGRVGATAASEGGFVEATVLPPLAGFIRRLQHVSGRELHCYASSNPAIHRCPRRAVT